MTIWTKEKCDFLRNNWGKSTARELAEQMGPGFTRNSIIGKASRLGLSAKIKTRAATSNENFENSLVHKRSKLKEEENKFKSLIIEKDFEPENPKQLEELTDNDCKYPIGHPNEKNFTFVEDLHSKTSAIVNFTFFTRTKVKTKKKSQLKKMRYQNLSKKR